MPAESIACEYVRIQVFVYAKAGEINGAVELLDKLFSEYPERLELAIAHVQMAECRIALGQNEAALGECRSALHAEKQLPTVRTRECSNSPWFVALHGMQDLCSERTAFWNRAAN